MSASEKIKSPKVDRKSVTSPKLPKHNGAVDWNFFVIFKKILCKLMQWLLESGPKQLH